MIVQLRRSIGYFALLCFVIVVADLFIVHSAIFEGNNQYLTIGIALDLVVVIPLLMYFLIIRKLKKKITVLLPVALLGYMSLLFIIPDSGQNIVEIVKFVVLPMEIIIFSYVIVKSYRAMRYNRQQQAVQVNAIEQLRGYLEQVYGHSRLVKLFVHELSVIYYSIFAWRTKHYAQVDSQAYSYHKHSNWLITILFLCKILMIEGVCIHILLMQWSHLAAWLLTIGNIYVVLLLIADYRAMCLNPIIVTKETIDLTYGLQMKANIAISEIDSISVIQYERLSKEKMKTSIVPLVVEPNVLIRLKADRPIETMLGRLQMVDEIYLFVDSPQALQAELNGRLT